MLLVEILFMTMFTTCATVEMLYLSVQFISNFFVKMELILVDYNEI